MWSALVSDAAVQPKAAAHFKEKHPGQQVMSVGSVHALIAQGTDSVGPR
jgi:hypothetical protein